MAWAGGSGYSRMLQLWDVLEVNPQPLFSWNYVSLKERFWSHVGSPRSTALPSLVPWGMGRELTAAAGS